MRMILIFIDGVGGIEGVAKADKMLLNEGRNLGTMRAERRFGTIFLNAYRVRSVSGESR